MLRASLVVCSAVLAFSVAGAEMAFGRSFALPKLNGTVGPGFTITLKKSGQAVKILKAGSYLFVISDKASIHNFTLERASGGMFETHLTSTAFVGTKTVKVTLAKGKWKFFCSVHQSLMHGFFSVT